ASNPWTMPPQHVRIPFCRAKIATWSRRSFCRVTWAEKGRGRTADRLVIFDVATCPGSKLSGISSLQPRHGDPRSTMRQIIDGIDRLALVTHLKLQLVA